MKNSTIEIYKKFLQTERKDWNEQIRRPIKKNILTAMLSTNNKLGADPSPLIKEAIGNKANIFFWSDQHFFHSNIIRYAGRPFENVSEMNQQMINNYYNTVKPEDLVFFCGDLAFGDINLTKNLFRGAPGKKVLVLGNHDFEKNKCLFRNYHIFDCITMTFDFNYKDENKNYEFIVSHYPIDEHFLPEGFINIHGHIHQYKLGKRHINVSVEHTQYKPLLLQELISAIDFK